MMLRENGAGEVVDLLNANGVEIPAEAEAAETA